MNGITLGLIAILILGLITIFLFLACILASLRDRKDDGYIERLNNTINKEVKVMSEFDVSKCKYYSNICKDKYGQNFYEYCRLYEDKCDKYPQCIYRDKQLQQLKAENEELREMNYGLSEKFANVCGGCFEQELREKYKQCLDEIEEICTHETINLTDSCVNGGRYVEILEKIKEVKGE